MPGELLYRIGAWVPLWSWRVRYLTTLLVETKFVLASLPKVPRSLTLWHRSRLPKQVPATFSLLFLQTQGAFRRSSR